MFIKLFCYNFIVCLISINIFRSGLTLPRFVSSPVRRWGEPNNQHSSSRSPLAQHRSHYWSWSNPCQSRERSRYHSSSLHPEENNCTRQASPLSSRLHQKVHVRPGGIAVSPTLDDIEHLVLLHSDKLVRLQVQTLATLHILHHGWSAEVRMSELKVGGTTAGQADHRVVNS